MPVLDLTQSKDCEKWAATAHDLMKKQLEGWLERATAASIAALIDHVRGRSGMNTANAKAMLPRMIAELASRPVVIEKELSAGLRAIGTNFPSEQHDAPGTIARRLLEEFGDPKVASLVAILGCKFVRIHAKGECKIAFEHLKQLIAAGTVLTEAQYRHVLAGGSRQTTISKWALAALPQPQPPKRRKRQ